MTVLRGLVGVLVALAVTVGVVQFLELMLANALAGHPLQSIADYAVVEPTEWNFHPQGAFAREAGRIVGKDDAAVKRLAQGLALSLDPCVEYEVFLS